MTTRQTDMTQNKKRHKRHPIQVYGIQPYDRQAHKMTTQNQKGHNKQI